jgi:hypothetical protein
MSLVSTKNTRKPKYSIAPARRTRRLYDFAVRAWPSSWTRMVSHPAKKSTTGSERGGPIDAEQRLVPPDEGDGEGDEADDREEDEHGLPRTRVEGPRRPLVEPGEGPVGILGRRTRPGRDGGRYARPMP